jgi:hypothetical protein
MPVCLGLPAHIFKNQLPKRKGMALMWLGALLIWKISVVKKVDGSKNGKVFCVHTMKAYSRIMVLDGGERSTSCPGCFIPQKRKPAPIAYEAGWAIQPVWMFWRR